MRGSHGRLPADPADAPVLLCSDPGPPRADRVAATEVKDLLAPPRARWSRPPPVPREVRDQSEEDSTMTRPITLFTGQWADLPFEEVCRLASEWGYDGLEIACWGDHFEVDKALADDVVRGAASGRRWPSTT